MNLQEHDYSLPLSNVDFSKSQKANHGDVIPCCMCDRTFVYRGWNEANDKYCPFCSSVCRRAYDNGFYLKPESNICSGFVISPEHNPIIKEGHKGYVIECTNCGKGFDSKGLRCCSRECEKEFKTVKKHIERNDNKMKIYQVAEWLDISEKYIKHHKSYDRMIIEGSNGYVYCDTDYWYLDITASSKRLWSAIKKKLPFMELVDEYLATMDNRPTGVFRNGGQISPDQAEKVRKVLGIRKRKHFTPEQLEQLKRNLALTRTHSHAEGTPVLEAA